MNCEYIKWFSPNLNQEMELKIYGKAGKPVLVFPAQGGRFFEFEDFGMIQAVESFIENERAVFFTVDSIDAQSWANFDAHPADRARRHENYDRYITQEVVPFIRERCQGQKCLATGCSMGGYHAANFYFRHPDLFDRAICLSGLMQLRYFLGEYMDDTVYLNSPLHYLWNLTDPWYLEQYKQGKIVVCVGQGAWENEMRADALALQQVLKEKQIPHWVDFWGEDVNHDWPWWRKQLPYFLGIILD